MRNIASSTCLHIREVSAETVSVRVQREENNEIRCISLGIDSEFVDATIFFRSKEEARLFLEESLRQLDNIK